MEAKDNGVCIPVKFRVDMSSFIPKQWGGEYILVNTDLYAAKVLMVRFMEAGSYHYHSRKHETFHVLDGDVLVRIEDKAMILSPGEQVVIPPLTRHLLMGLSPGTSYVLETSTHDDPDDTHRLWRFTREIYESRTANPGVD